MGDGEVPAEYIEAFRKIVKEELKPFGESIGRVEQGLDRLEQRVGNIEQRLYGLEQSMDRVELDRVEQGLAEFEHGTRKGLNDLGFSIRRLKRYEIIREEREREEERYLFPVIVIPRNHDLRLNLVEGGRIYSRRLRYVP